MSSKFENLPARALKRIIFNLSLCDFLSLSSTSHTLYNICNSNDIWRSIFKQHFGYYSTIHDYGKFLEYNNWKTLCYDIFLRNVHDKEFIEYLLSNSKSCDEFSDDSDTETLHAAKVWPSIARTNLFESTQHILHHQYNDIDISDCDEQILEIAELHNSISSASLESFTLIDLESSSKANFLLNGPSNSVATIHEIKEKVENVNELSKHCNNENEDTLGIGFTRNEMRRRLNNLVKLSFKNFSGDPEDLLPATKNGKYALRYREEKKY